MTALSLVFNTLGIVVVLAILVLAGAIAWCEHYVRKGVAESCTLVVVDPVTGDEVSHAFRAKPYHQWPLKTPWREEEVVYAPMWWWPLRTFFGRPIDRRPVIMFPGRSLKEDYFGHALGHCEQWARDPVRMGTGYIRDLLRGGYDEDNPWEIGAEQFRRGCCTLRDGNGHFVRHLIDAYFPERLAQSRVWRVVDRRRELPEIKAKAAA